ncbi:MAG TPA: DoxX family membrane protein, partial [Gemmatimonadota bacterium]|nr:DoxX family membrane protein [Gemmatimonadota bacterium]
MSAALLILRLVLGLGLAAHGAQKLFGWFGGHGLAGTGGFFEGLGFRPGKAFAVLAGLGEFGGGILLALGLGGPLGPAVVVLVMLVAIGSVHLEN